MRINESQFDRAAELFYEAAALPDQWPGALEFLGNSLGAVGVEMLPVHTGSVICSTAFTAIIQDFVASRWFPDNPFMRRGLELTRAGLRGLISSAEMLTPEEMARDPFVNEWRRKFHLGPQAGMLLVNQPPDLIMPITFEQRVTDEPYERTELAKMNRLLTLLKPAVNLALKVGFSASRRMADSIGQPGREIILFSRSGRVLHAPPALEERFGDALYLRAGTLCAWNHDANERLSSAVKRATSTAPPGERVARSFALPRKHGGLPLIGQVVPLAGAAHDVFMLARAALVISDPLAKLDSASASVREWFGLTASEARMALRIAAGEQLMDIAAAENITIETARSRLKLVLAKTRTHRQAELALLISSFGH
jgi:DNA-binding CsgD family transcriptional regulator